MEISSKTCYVKFKDKASCDVSQHLTNTVFIDRPLVVVPLTEGMSEVACWLLYFLSLLLKTNSLFMLPFKLPLILSYHLCHLCCMHQDIF